MAQLVTFCNDKSSLVDIAVSLITGKVTPTFFTGVETAAAGSLFPAIIQQLTSNILPTNGNLTGRSLFQKDDDDYDLFIPTNGKAVEGSLFVALREMSTSYLGTTVNSEIESFLNDLRQIVDDADIMVSQRLAYHPTQTTRIASDGELQAIGMGFLKETQTDDYNPLTVINADWEYLMFDVKTVKGLLSARS